VLGEVPIRVAVLLGLVQHLLCLMLGGASGPVERASTSASMEDAGAVQAG
jgi:hypothetical protein